MRPDRLLRIEQLRIVEEFDGLVVCRHESSVLRLDDLPFDLLVAAFTEPGNVSPVDAPGVRALKLRQQLHVLVVRADVVLAEDALYLFLGERIRFQHHRCIAVGG